ncbi:DMT family transporter [Monaibacterium marinum]|nr:DMT family transporter [Monaibacterium marinum]
MKSSPDKLSYAAIGLLTIVWGSAFALTTVALQGYGPMQVVTARAGLAALVLVSVAYISGQGLPRSLNHWMWCALFGINSLALPFTLLTWAQLTIDSAVAAVLISSSPLFVLLLSKFILGTQVGPRKWLGFSIGFVGLGVLIGPGILRAVDAPLLPQLACLGTAFCYAMSAVLVRRMPELPPVQATAASQLSAAVVLVPFGAVGLVSDLTLGTPLIALAVLGLVQTGGAQLLRYWTVKRSGAVFASTVGYLIPIWAGMLGVTLLGEPITWQLVIGFGLIVSGLLVAGNRPEGQRTAAASSAG